MLGLEALEPRVLLSGTNLNELVDTSVSATQLASALVGPGVSVSNVTFTGDNTAKGTFAFADPTVVGFNQGIVLSSGNAADVVGPNTSDSYSADFVLPGDADLDTLSGYTTYDATVLEFDFIPTSNQVVFYYAFASDEYPEWVNTPYNDVFAFFVNGENYAVVRQTAGDPNAPFVPVAVNNINDGNPLDPAFVPTRPDLFRPNYVTTDGTPSAIDLELDGITKVLTFQAPVIPGVVNHMKLAIADASDGIYDSAVFIQAGSLVSNDNPVADLSLTPSIGDAPLNVTAIVEGEDPNGLPLTYSIDWGDGSPNSTGELTDPVDENEKTALVNHTYTTPGDYIVTLTVSNGSLVGTSVEDVDVMGQGSIGAPEVTTEPEDLTVYEGELFSFIAAAWGSPEPDVQWQVSTDAGDTFVDIPGANTATYSGTANLADNGNLYRAVFTNSEGSAISNEALLTVLPQAGDTTPPVAPGVALANDTGNAPDDLLTNDGALNLSDIEESALVEYSIDGGATWAAAFAAVEGENHVQVRQTDLAGNVSDAASLIFTLDTTPPTISNPTFSTTQPFLVGATGITLSASVNDAWGIASQSSGTIDTTTAGPKSVTYTAVDQAGNTASLSVPYVVGYKAVNVLPVSGATFKRKASIPVSFQVADANGLISHQAALSLQSALKVQFGNLAPVSVKYNKKTSKFAVTVKTYQPLPGTYDLAILGTLSGATVLSEHVSINIV